MSVSADTLRSRVAVKVGVTDPLLSRAEAAEYLGIRPQTLAVWHCTKRHQIPVVMIGNRCKYLQSSLDAFVARRTIGAAS